MAAPGSTLCGHGWVVRRPPRARCATPNRVRQEVSPLPTPLRVGFIGTGGIAQRHLKSLRQLGPERARPVAFCDIDEARAAQAAAGYGGTVYTDSKRMVDAEDGLDAVFVCTPPFARAEPIEAAAARGLAIFCEKPPAFDAEQGRRALAAIRRAGVITNVGFMYRWLRAVDRARDLLEGRTIAAVRSAFLCGPAVERNLPAWFYLQDRSGGPLMDQAIHVLDLHRYFAGEVASVHALAHTTFREHTADFTIQEAYSLNLAYASGAIASHLHSWACTAAMGQVEWISDRARLAVDLFANRLIGTVDGTPVDETFTDDPYLREVDQFLRAVADGDGMRMRSPYADGLHTCAVAWAGLRSAATGRVETPERFTQ